MGSTSNAPLPTYDPKTNAVLLYSEDVTTVMPDGKTKGIERRVYKILRPEGREYAVAHAHVGHDTHVGSMRGWCIPKSGKDYEVKDKDAIEKTVEGFGELVTDIRVRTLPIPAGERATSWDTKSNITTARTCWTINGNFRLQFR
jgi:hypothetical protein